MKGLLLTYVMAYGGAVVALFQPLVGAIIYAIFSTARPQMLFGFAGDMSGISQVVGWATLIGWAAKGFGNWQLKRAWGPILLLFGFFFWTLLSALFASNQELAQSYVIERLKILLVILVSITLIDSEVWIRRFAWALVVAQGYVAFEMNFAYYFKGFNLAVEQGLLGDNNSFAISLVAMIGPAAFLGIAADRLWKKGIAFTCAVLILHNVILTYSRGGLLSLFLTGAATFLVMPKRPALLVALLVGALLTARLMGPEVTARFKTSFASEDQRDTSAQSRVILWGNCLDLIAQSPVVGVGPSHFPLMAPQFGWPKGKSAHSLWLQSAAELGIPAVTCLLGFYLVSAYRGWRDARAFPSTARGMFGLYVFSGLTGFILSAQFVSIEGLEVPYFIALISAASMKVLGSGEPTSVPALDSPQPARHPSLQDFGWSGPTGS